MRQGLLLRVLMGIILCGTIGVSPEPSWSAPSDSAKVDCAKQDDATVEFTPRAFTLGSVYVRTKAPEYSLLKGRWVLGDVMEVLRPNTCLHVLKREDIGVVQVWYLVRYQDATKQVRTGWVWGGTKDKDEGRYVGGVLPPLMKSAVPFDTPSYLSGWSLLSVAYAQGDELPPSSTIVSGGSESVASGYLVVLPVVGWEVSLSTISAMALFVVMLAGMVAKAIWDETEGNKGRWPSWDKMLRPFLVSPIAFSAFWGPMYLQSGGGLSLTMTLYAFQIGFMWQHVLEKKGSG